MGATDRIIVIGDVHGCHVDLVRLLETVRLDLDRDQVVFVGDLIDRGPDSPGVLQAAKNIGAICVRGNHEGKHIAMAEKNARMAAGGAPNLMRPYDGARLAEHEEYVRDGWIAWFKTWPLWYRLPLEGYAMPWYAVHAGCEPGRGVELQDENVLTRCRYVRPAPNRPGGWRASGHQEKIVEKGDIEWEKRWDQGENVIFGHRGDSLTEATVLRKEGGVETWGIDTGCGYGGKLSALVFDNTREKPVPELVQIQTETAYAVWGSGE